MNNNSENLSLNCPYCNKATYVFSETGTFSFSTQIWDRAILKQVNKDWWAGSCRACGKPILVINHGESIYPVPQPRPTSDKIPDDIRMDLDEAKLCFSVKAYRGCAVLSRRAIQNACLEKGTTKDDLVGQINELFDKNIITKELREWATDVRWIGNDAAHINKEPVEADDAEDSLKLAESFLEILYVIPKISEESRRKRNKA